jgi:hypothetical protein
MSDFSNDPNNGPQGPVIRLPGGGDLDMSHYQPITTYLSAVLSGALSQIGFINIYETNTDHAALEQNIIGEVGSYGRQLGWVIDALQVVCRRLDLEHNQLNSDDEKAVVAFNKLADDIAKAKREQMIKYRGPLTQEEIDKLAKKINEEHPIVSSEEAAKIITDTLKAIDTSHKGQDEREEMESRMRKDKPLVEAIVQRLKNELRG